MLTLTLEAAGAFTGVDAGLIRIPGPDGCEPLFATLEMSTDEARRQPVAGPPGGQPARAVRIGYTYTHAEIRDESDLIRRPKCRHRLPRRRRRVRRQPPRVRALGRRAALPAGAVRSGRTPDGPFERLHLSAGIAQLRQDDDVTSFFERADEALYQAKEAGKGQFMAADGLG